MANTKRKAGLEIDVDERFTRRDWTVERAGWVGMGLVVLAGLLGAFGKGRLSAATASVGGQPLRVEYERIARPGATSTMHLVLAPGAAPAGSARLLIDHEHLHGVELRHITPEPDSSWLTPEYVGFAVSVPDPTDSATVSVTVQPDEYWSRSARVALNDGPAVSFRQFILP